MLIPICMQAGKLSVVMNKAKGTVKDVVEDFRVRGRGSHTGIIQLARSPV